MRKRRLTNYSEGKALGILERAFRGTSYVAHPKVRLADVVAVDDGDEFAPGDRDYLLRAHLDFVVCDRSQAMTPVFAVEFDGPSHASEVQRARDIRKNRLCTLAGLPLLRIGEAEVQDHDRLTLLGHMMARTVAWKVEAPSIQADLEARIEEEIQDTGDPDALRRVVAPDGFLDPTYDVHFQFHVGHLFPGIGAVSKRLWTRYRMSSLFDLETYHVCDYALILHRSGIEFIRSSCLFWRSYVIAATDGRPPNFSDGELKSGRLLESGRVQFSIQAALQTQEDYDWTETGAEYFARTGTMPFSDVSVPGASMFDIGETFADYLCLRDAEKWATANLRRANHSRERARS